MTEHYTIRYRNTGSLGTNALIVEDEAGTAFLYIDRSLQVRIEGERACDKLVRLAGGGDSWNAVPRVAPYSLEALRELLTGGDEASPGPADP